jgi:putative PIN family toxin of toxin-antitoxin system
MPKNKNEKIRVVVDANGWISSLLSPGFRVRLEIVFGMEYQLIVSEQLFRELDRAIRKPSLERQINHADHEKLLFLLRTDAELVDVHSVVEICRDPKDNFLLALAKDGDADYLITGDEDLRVLKEFGKTKIVTLTDFETTRR